jgi:hypothetical protein
VPVGKTGQSSEARLNYPVGFSLGSCLHVKCGATPGILPKAIGMKQPRTDCSSMKLNRALQSFSRASNVSPTAPPVNHSGTWSLVDFPGNWERKAGLQLSAMEAFCLDANATPPPHSLFYHPYHQVVVCCDSIATGQGRSNDTCPPRRVFNILMLTKFPWD